LDRQEINELIRRYRKKNQATDVLAFPADEKSYLGEILLCQEKIKENAARFNQPFERELARTAIHGLLHLLGYNHERGGKEAKKMIEQQEKYLSEIKHS
jgi:probable rRNA maturation factor